MTDIPFDALCRLNAHARTPAAYSQRRAIYAYKTLAALALCIAGDTQMRFITWTGKCNRCKDGRYQHWDWDDGYSVSCRDCSGTGYRTLKFVSTTLPGGKIWFHPWRESGCDLAAALLGITYEDSYRATAAGQLVEWHHPGIWRPNLPGFELSLEELVTCLNEVEDWVETFRLPEGRYQWKHDQARRHLRQRKSYVDNSWPSEGYIVDLGRAPGGCFICGDEGDLDSITLGRMTSLFHWSLPVCRTHRQSPHPKDPPAAALITPAIRQWMERHDKRVPVS